MKPHNLEALSSRRPWSLTILLLAGSLLACGGDGAGSSGLASDGGTVEGGGAGSGGTGSGGTAGSAGSPSAACSTYIECVAQTTPIGLDAVIAAYGSTGSCWAQGDEDLCQNACRTGTIAAHQAFPSEEACNICDTSADCPFAQPACDVGAGRCVDCVSDVDCVGSDLPACEPATSTCVGCLGDHHCSDGKRCELSNNTCVGCFDNSDCWQGDSGWICDATSRECRVCLNDGECGAGVCVGGSCVQCRNNMNCGGATPYCDTSSHLCVGCSNDDACAPGVCSGGTCCGQTACSDASAECGYVTDASCTYSENFACGTCPSNEVCFNNGCTPNPPKDCGACGGGPCGYVPENNAYECLGASPTCTGSSSQCGPGYQCQTKQVGPDVFYSCHQYCLSDDDCAFYSGCAIPTGSQTNIGTCI